MVIITEGKARVEVSIAEDKKISKKLEVFYNPIMKFNRDMSVLVLNALDLKDLQIADILAGSGIRSLRFLLELDKGKIKELTVNDSKKDFITLFDKSLELNNLSLDGSTENVVLQKTCKDANILLLESKGYDYIEIDPFGSPNDFLDASIARLSRRGILAVTATDTAPLAGTYPLVSKRKYWGVPLRNFLMHEVGLRILIRKIQLIGAQHEKAMIPIFAYFKDHYFRIFFRSEKNKTSVDALLKKHQYLHFCNSCLNIVTSQTNILNCDTCDKKMLLAGPLWIGNLTDPKLAKEMYENCAYEDSKDVLKTMLDESLIETLGFYDIHALCRTYELKIPSYSALMDAVSKKYPVVRTHFTLLGMKSTIPIAELVKIIESLEK